MTNQVLVGGVEVNQETLERAHAWLAANGSPFVSAGYRPSITRFREPSGSTISPEEYVYLLFADPKLAPDGFRQAFIDPPYNPDPRELADVLRAAGFPALAATRAPTCEVPARGRIEAWAAEAGRECAPWLWIMGSTPSARTMSLAWAVLLARHAIDGTVMYVRVADLVELINSSDMYGQLSKFNAARPYRTCELLVLDGMGEETHGVRELTTIQRVVDARSRDLLVTVFSSPFGLKRWTDAYGPTERPKARDVAAQIAEGLGGFPDGLGKAESSAAVAAHVINLSKEESQ